MTSLSSLGRGPALALCLLLAGCSAEGSPRSARDARARDLDELSALWSAYRYGFIEDGRVLARDEKDVTTSEGQSYAMLRAVWSGDRATFDASWRWTREHLQVRPGDKLLAWRWKDKVLDANAATDADVDTALALVLASRRFGSPRYLEDARAILADVWKHEVVRAGDRWFATAGNWAPGEPYPTIHVGYLAPAAYEVFASVDPERPWRELVDSSYDLLHRLFFEEGLRLPPEKVWLDPKSGRVLLENPLTRARAEFGYDVVPLYFRLALDAEWFGRGEHGLRSRMLEPLAELWARERKVPERATTGGKLLSKNDGWPQAATVAALAFVEDRTFAAELRKEKVDPLLARAIAGEPTPYYLHNWLWFSRALELQGTRRYDEFLGFLRPFDWEGFRARFPAIPFAIALALFPLALRFRLAKAAFLALSLALVLRYLGWRAATTLNFVEPGGLLISGSLLVAELYGLSTVVLLLVQVGLGGRRRPAPPPLAEGEHHPTVDVLVPIYSESLDILDRTLAAACAMRYPRLRVHVCDDSHREEVAALAASHGASYIRGPKKHAKAGNLNNALSQLDGELVVVFDTDHIPAATFLERTVPHFRDAQVGAVQTPHHFYNDDIFQRALGAGARVPNEQDMFNHAIQGGRDAWGGAFFVGSGAVFRRAALDEVGGFNLLSITEDIHTCQKIHGKGWKTAFVDEDLAVGLSAETFAGYLVQRRRWMLGCLQIFLKDNPLREKGLSPRQRVGYFASLWYFFFPLARVVFWATPLWFLLFHLHPLFADVSELLGYLLPSMVLLPLASAALLPGWPRAFWGAAYEMVVAFPLARAMADLFLPKRLGFKVTPKGVVTEKRSFDLASSRLTVVAAAISAIAVAKGLAEFHLFGIEKDAYFFNLAWAAFHLVTLAGALVVAWERPQRRAEERARVALPVALHLPGEDLLATTVDVGLGGVAVALERPAALPPTFDVTLGLAGAPLKLRARRVRQERAGRRIVAGLAFVDPPAAARQRLVREVFGRAETWAAVHRRRPRTGFGMAWEFLLGLGRAVRPLVTRRRATPRARAWRRLSFVAPGGPVRALVVDRSAGGLGLWFLGAAPEVGAVLPVLGAGSGPGSGPRWARVAHRRRAWFGATRAGLEFIAAPASEAAPREWLAA